MADIKYTDLSGLDYFGDKIKSILDNKANTSSFGSYYTKAQVDNLLTGKSDTHNHPYASSSHGHSELTIEGISDPNLAYSDQKLKYYLIGSTNNGAPGYAGKNYGFPVSHNANSILWLGNHSGNYGGQLGISGNGYLYYRCISSGSFPTTANGASWNRIAYKSEIPTTLPANGGNADTATKATNDSDGNAINTTYLKKSGGTMTGNITYDTDSHGIYFYNNCGIEKWTGYGPCLVAEGNTTDFWIRNGTDRSKAYKIYHTGNLTKTTLGLSNVDNTADADKNVKYATTADNSNKLGGYDDSVYFAYRGWDTTPGKDANTAMAGVMGSNFSYSNNCPNTGPLLTFHCAGYNLQLNGAYSANEGKNLAFRLRNGDHGTNHPWYTICHSGNIGDYALTSLPSHNHDDRYYTETEVNNLLTGKSNTNHTHNSLGSYFIFNDNDVPEGATNLSNTTVAHTTTFYRNGISIPYKMDNSNDGGLIRVRGNTEDNVVFEMATWDDSGAGETIQFNYYPTTSQITPTYSVSVPKKSGTIALTNDIPTSLPASDVYGWAKAVNKPTYTAGEVGATTDTHGDGYIMKYHKIDASSLDTNTYYPVTMHIGSSPNVRIEIRNSLNSNVPSWSTHSSGFSTRKIWEVNGAGWGTNTVNRRILASDYSFASSDPVRGIEHMSNSSHEVVYVRGGGVYHFYLSHGITPTLRTSTFVGTAEPYYQAVSPTTTAPSGIYRNIAFSGESQPASDVYAWAKASSKPTYTASEVGAAPATHSHDYFPITGGSLSGDNRTIGSTMGGGTDSWSIGGYGTGDNGECRITINDNSNDIFAIQIEDYSGTVYRPMVVKNTGVYGTAFYQDSDERLKDFSDDIQVDLDKIKSLPKKYFTWKDDESKEQQIGTSAQAIQEIYPELVSTGDNGKLSVAYDKLSIIALKAVDELHDENQKLKNEINQLRSDIDQIKQMLGI